MKTGKKFVSRIVKVEATIEKCFYDCPYFETEGMERCMVCKHPSAKDKPYIISHPDCYNGFPEECPLFEEIEQIPFTGFNHLLGSIRN